MAIEDNIAGMSPQELANLLGNANRLGVERFSQTANGRRASVAG
ncbi:MAG: hypothetical protein WDM79_12310 [Terricaulis sp.]